MGFIVVICAGGWPLAQFFEPLVQAFKARNHPAICSPPESYPILAAPAKVNPDSEHLRTQVLEPLLREERDIVIFMHSYGGIYGPEALKGMSKKERQEKGLKGGVIAAIFNAAFAASTGTTAVEAMGIDLDNPPEWIEHDKSTGLVAMNKEHAKAMLFHDLPNNEAERLADLLPTQPIACFTTPTQWDPFQDPNYRFLGYIFTELDRILPLEAQRHYAKLAGIEVTHMLEGSSHSPHLEKPEELAEVVLKMVETLTTKGDP